MYLKQSTAYTFRLGPFVDSTDGNTQENALTIAYTDVLLAKAGGALAAKSDTTALTGTGANAHYTCVLNATDTNTLGYFRVWCHVTGALAAYKDFIVLSANVYDSLVAGSDALQVDTIQIGGTTQTANDASGDVDTILSRVVGTIATGTHNPQSGDSFPLVSTEVSEIYAAVITNAAGVDIAADIIAVKADTAAILLDTGTDGVVLPQAQADKVWGTAARILTANTNFNDPTAAVVADAVWDELVTGHDGVGKAGAQLWTDIDAIAVDVAGLDGAAMRGTDSAALASVCTEARLAELDAANLPATTDAILVDTGTTLDARIPAALVGGKMDASVGAVAAGVDLSATMKTSINAEVLDVLNVDTFAEPGQEAPAATNTIAKKIGYLFKFIRNKVTQDATTLKVYADDGTTVDQKSTVSDDATTYTREEIGSGP